MNTTKKNAKVSKKDKYPIAIKRPSLSSIPKANKKMDHPAERLDKGIGRGKDKIRPSNNSTKP